MNRALGTVLTVVGVIFGISGMNHGFFEALQGFTPTPGLIIKAIGPAQRMWERGTEEALTIVPNFLVTGLLAMGFGLAIIIWSLRSLGSRPKATVFILLFLALFLTGGGIGHLIFFLPAWGFITLINKPLTWWKKILPTGLRQVMAKTWPYSVTAMTILILFALEIAIAGYVPGMTDADQKSYFCWSCLGIGWLLMMYSFVAAISADIKE